MAVAIVTGASKGLGLALALGLAAEGYDLVLDARHGPPLRAAAAAVEAAGGGRIRVRALAGDVSETGHRREIVAAAGELGGLDLLVNNASALGPSPLPPLATLDLDAYRHVLEVDCVAPLALIQEALPQLRRSPDPRVLNVTSDAAVEHYEGWGGYGSAKAALDHLSTTLAVEENGVRVFAVDPGDMRTDMHQAAFPGEDISDRPEPEAVVPALLALVGGDARSGRYRAAELAALRGQR